MLTGMRDDDDIVPTGSPHAHVRAHWIHHACPCPCPLDSRTPVFVPDGSPHTCTHQVPTHICSQGPMRVGSQGPTHVGLQGPTRVGLQGPCVRLLVGSPYMHALGPCTHAHTGSPRLLARRVPHTCWLVGSPSVLTRGVSIPHAPGPCTCTRTGSPHTFARRVPTCAHSRVLHTHMLQAHACVLARRVSMHVYMCPLDASCVHPSAVCIGRVICSSSSTVL